MGKSIYGTIMLSFTLQISNPDEIIQKRK